MPLQRLTMLINCFAIDWIATIFPAEKSRNDTRFFILVVVEQTLYSQFRPKADKAGKPQTV